MLGAFGALPIHLDLARLDSVGGHGSRFEKTCRPEPFVEPYPDFFV
jgi:hypothetical protein